MTDQCPSCKKQFAVPEAAIGKKVRCSGCQAVFVVAAPPPAAATEMLDVLEEIIDEPPAKVAKKKTPAKKKGTPAPPTSAPADDNPFALPGGTAGGADAAASLDFSSEEPRLNAGVRMRIAGAGRMMMMGAGMSLVLSLLMVVNAMFARALGGLIAAGIIYVIAIVIILCARSLNVLRSRGLGVTAAILCLLVSLAGLGGAITALLLLIASFNAGAMNAVIGTIALVLGVVSLAQLVNCLWGGISTLLFIFRDDVGEAIQASLEREARIAATSTTLVPDSCRRAAIWQILAAMLVFLHVAVYGGFLGLLLWRPAPGSSLFLNIALGVAIFFFLVVLLLNAGAAVALFMRRFYVLALLGGVACLVSALFSYIGGVIELPFIVAALVARDPILLTIAIAAGVFIVLLNIVGLAGFVSGMDAARLLRKYGGGPGAKAATDS
jgi:predicted Zn finger-like uncharacterized protein